MLSKLSTFAAGLAIALSQATAHSDQNVYILDVPDYTWYVGCFGTASGNLMGFWDRHGFPDFYTGPTNGGIAPLTSGGSNSGITAMWASKAGVDGRPGDRLGHMDDYWKAYENVQSDPYMDAGRAEHEPDCLGDFIGASQKKWTMLDGECNGNIDGYAFNFWNKQGLRRENYVPPTQGGAPLRDLQSGLRNWVAWRGYEASVFSQLTDFNRNIPAGTGFTYEDLKAEIDAGYPVMLFLQNPTIWNRDFPDMQDANPSVHGMLAYGYYEDSTGAKKVRYKTSWGSSGFNRMASWAEGIWEIALTLRGVIGFHPLPKLRSITRESDGIHLAWDGPSAQLYDINTATSTALHYYVVEKLDSLESTNVTTVTSPSTNLQAVLPASESTQAFFRVRLLKRSEVSN